MFLLGDYTHGTPNRVNNENILDCIIIDIDLRLMEEQDIFGEIIL